MSICEKTNRKRQDSLTCSDDDKFLGNLWLETGSPVKQQGVNDGRVSEVRNKGKISTDAASDGGRVEAASIRHCDNVAPIEA